MDGEVSCALLEYLKKAVVFPNTEKCRVLGPSDIVYERGLGSLALKANGSTQQVLLKFHFGCVTYSEKIPSGDYTGYFAKLGIFTNRQIL